MAEAQGVAAAESVIDMVITRIADHYMDLYLEPKRKPYAASHTNCLMQQLLRVSVPPKKLK